MVWQPLWQQREESGNLVQGAVTSSAPTYGNAQTSPISLDTSGNLRINCITGCAGGNSGTSATDEATFTQGTTTYTAIGGLYNSAVANLASGQGGAVQLTNDRQMKVNASVSSGAYAAGALAAGALASGAGVDGWDLTKGAKADSVCGTATGTCSVVSLLKYLNNSLVASGATTSGETGRLVMGAVTTAAPSYTTAQTSPLSLDTSGNLRVNVVAGGAGGGAVYGPTAVGSANANPPVVIGGTATGAAGQNVEGVAVKPASTASVATDLSLVTNESPNSQLSVTAGTTADSAYAGSGSASIIAALKGIYAASTGAVPAGTALIGKVGIDQTTAGTTNGAAIVGVNAATALAGNGATGTGSLRVTTASDNSAVPLWGHGPVTPGTAATGTVLAGATYNSTAPTFTTGQQGPVQVSSHGGLLLGNGYPAGSTPITISGTGTTAATTATLATGTSVTTYICGFSIRANATAAATGNSTVTGTITGTMNYTQWTSPNASGIGVTEQIFTPCIPASAANTSIAVISAAPGTGGVVSVTAWGYTL